MLRLEKSKQLDRLPENEAKIFRAEIRASRKVLNLFKDIIEESIQGLRNDQINLLDTPNTLAGNILTIQELKKLTQLLQETEK